MLQKIHLHYSNLTNLPKITTTLTLYANPLLNYLYTLHTHTHTHTQSITKHTKKHYENTPSH